MKPDERDQVAMGEKFDVESFVRREMDYFAPMCAGSVATTEAVRSAWRQETVAQRQVRISREVYQICGGSVRYGPFADLKLCDDNWWGCSDLGSQCLGLYEKEILDLIARRGGAFSTFVDIGAADGYYAVGMLQSGLVSQAVCFEKSQKGRATIEKNWNLNGAPGQLDIFAEATAQSIQNLSDDLLSRALILIDIEGAEFDLLRPAVLEKLRFCEFWLEIHNWVEEFPEKYQRLLHEASVFFDVSVIPRVERPTVHLDELRSFTDDNRLLLTSERRPCLMRFLRLAPDRG